MSEYIEIMGAVVMRRRELEDDDLRQIGEFTRENVLTWMESHTGLEWIGLFPVEDFHAVCGDVDVPWATEKARLCWMKLFEPFHL